MNWLFIAARLLIFTWIVNGVILMMGNGHQRPEWVAVNRWIWAELRLFYLPAVAIVIGSLVLRGEVLGWNTLVIFCDLMNWFMLKNLDDDDRWKRRRKKLSEKVARVGGRLVAVPVKAGA